MTRPHKERLLKKLGAREEDMDALISYTANVFKADGTDGGAADLQKFASIADKAVNICKTPPRIEMFESAAGIVPIIYATGTTDFENMVTTIVKKGKHVPHVGKMGAVFAYGKSLRFIILSDKPYSGIAAGCMEPDEDEWIKKSVVIRKHHECAHYYTKRYLGSTRNNLHDELIADFCGLYAAFGEFRAEWFTAMIKNRSEIYTTNLSAEAAEIIKKIAQEAAIWVEEWTKSEAFLKMSSPSRTGSEAKWIEYLAGKELLFYIDKTKKGEKEHERKENTRI